MAKRILAVVIALAMIITTLSVAVFAAPTFEDLVAAGGNVDWTGGDVVLTDTVVIGNNTVIDLNGATVTGADDKAVFRIKDGANVTVTDGTVFGKCPVMSASLSSVLSVTGILSKTSAIVVENGALTIKDTSVFGGTMFGGVAKEIESGIGFDGAGLPSGFPVASAVSLRAGTLSIDGSILVGKCAVENSTGTSTTVESGILAGYLGAFSDAASYEVGTDSVAYDLFDKTIRFQDSTVADAVNALAAQVRTGTAADGKFIAVVKKTTSTSADVQFNDDKSVVVSSVQAEEHSSSAFSYKWVPSYFELLATGSDTVLQTVSLTYNSGTNDFGGSCTVVADGDYDVKVYADLEISLVGDQVTRVANFFDACESGDIGSLLVADSIKNVSGHLSGMFEGVLASEDIQGKIEKIAHTYEDLYSLWGIIGKGENTYSDFMAQAETYGIENAEAILEMQMGSYLADLGLTVKDFTGSSELFDAVLAIIPALNPLIGTYDELHTSDNEVLDNLAAQPTEAEHNANPGDYPYYYRFKEFKGGVGFAINLIRSGFEDVEDLEGLVSFLNDACDSESDIYGIIEELPAQIDTLNTILAGEKITKVINAIGFSDYASLLKAVPSKLGNVKAIMDKYAEKAFDPATVQNSISSLGSTISDFVVANYDASNNTVKLTSEVVKTASGTIESVATAPLHIYIEGYGESTVTVEGYAAASDITVQAVAGQTFEITVNVAEGEALAFWTNDNDRIYSFEKDLSLEFTTATHLTAHIVPAEEYLYYIVDQYNTLLTVCEYYDEVESYEWPETAGYNFADYSEQDYDGFFEIVKGNYTANTTYNVSIYGGLIYEVEIIDGVVYTKGEGKTTMDVQVGTMVAVVSTTDGFAAWTIDGAVASTASVYGFIVRSNTVVQAITAADITEPIVGLSSSRDVNGNAVFTETRLVPEGYTFMEAGILLTKDDTATLTVENYPEGDSTILRGVTLNTAPNGTYTVTKSNSSGQTWYGVGYLMYKDGSGTIYTIYTSKLEA